MKKFLLVIFAFAFSCICLNAQSRGEKDAVNLQLIGGINFSQNESIDGELKHLLAINSDALSGNGYISVAQEFHPIFGWRASIGFSGNKGRANDYSAKVADIYSFNDMELFGDITIDLMDLFGPRRKNYMFNMKLFGGVGGLYGFGYPKNYSNVDSANKFFLGLRTGLDFRFRVSRKVCILLEGSALFEPTDKFNGIVDDVPFDARLNANLGITVDL